MKTGIDRSKLREIVYYVRIEMQHLTETGSIRYQLVPKSTVTILIDEEGNVARGVAMCSTLDIFNKKEGRAISFNRAIAGLVNKKSIGPINRDDVHIDEGIDFKIEFDPTLTAYEEKLVQGSKK